MFTRRLFRIVLALVLLWFVTEATIMTVARVAETAELADVFAPLAPLMPGQPFPAPELRSYSCQNVPAEAGLDVCRVVFEEGVLVSAYVYVQRRRINLLTVIVRGLSVGHLAARWGRPDRIHQRDSTKFIVWGRAVAASAPTAGRFSYFLPVIQLRFF